MNKLHSQRKGCKDVFKSFLVTSANYCGIFEFPRIYPCYEIPKRLITFSKSISCKDYDQWVHFFEDDCLFERIWNNPKRYLHILKRYRGVILPDFSLYRDMSFAMQLWNIYRSRAIGCWLQKNGVPVIVNVRFGDKRTYHCTCDGVAKHGVIAVGSYSTLQDPEDRRIFATGLKYVVNNLQPKVIVVYGGAPDSIFAEYKTMRIKIVCFESDLAIAHKEVG